VSELEEFTLSPDLRSGVVPISKAASSLAALIKRANAEKSVIVITQKGYPSGVLLSPELFQLQQQAAEQADVAA
jgi:prevent-host-death family protein